MVQKLLTIRKLAIIIRIQAKGILENRKNNGKNSKSHFKIIFISPQTNNRIFSKVCQ